MDDKNRFSILLEHLLEVAEVKNYTLAKHLQYDVSYISKWVSGRIVNDFQYVADPNMFLSGAASYLRLDNNCPVNRIAMVNNSVMEDRLSEYFDQVWNLDDQNVTKERNAIAEHIHHVLQGIHLITRAKSDEMEELQESWMNKI